jgi:hypothetical protein
MSSPVPVERVYHALYTVLVVRGRRTHLLGSTLLMLHFSPLTTQLLELCALRAWDLSDVERELLRLATDAVVQPSQQLKFFDRYYAYLESIVHNEA